MAATFFISDLHLALQASNVEAQKLDKLQVLFERIGNEGGALYLVGDILDYWLEFHHVIPKEFSRFFCMLSSLVQQGVQVFYVAGNHDFELGSYFTQSLGITTAYGINEVTIEGKRFFVAHGDGLGEGDTGYKIFARLIRTRFSRFVLQWLHPDLTIGFMKWVSQLSREHKPTNSSFEVDRLLHFAHSLRAEQEFDYFVCGHNHVQGVHELAEGSRYFNLGTWIHGNYSYGVFKEGKFDFFDL